MADKIKVKDPVKFERPVYHCNTCNKSFGSQLDLEAHMRIDHKSACQAA